jgi:AcrR family transcriptional regulator
MQSTGTPAAKPGLRERKKQRTRETIIKAALELFADRGYAHTTLEDIADAAEVSTGTLFAYFPSKEDILFPEERPFYEELKQRLEQRPAAATTFDVLREFLDTLEPPDETFSQRRKILTDQGLRLKQRVRWTRVEQLLTESIEKDLGAAPSDLRPTLLAASAAAALTTVGDRLRPESGEPIPYEQALAILDEIFKLLRDGLDEPQRTQ